MSVHVYLRLCKDMVGPNADVGTLSLWLDEPWCLSELSTLVGGLPVAYCFCQKIEPRSGLLVEEFIWEWRNDDCGN